VITISKIHLFT